MYCLTRKTLKCNSLVQKLCLFLQKETSHWRNNLALGPQKPKQYIFGDQFYLPKSSDSMYSSYFKLENMWNHLYTWSGLNSQEIINFVPIVGLQGPELNWNKFTISCEFDPLQVKWGYHTFYIIKIEEYMEPKLSGFFWVKMVVKNIVLRSLGTHFMHVRVKQTRSSIETNVIGVKKYIYISLFKFYWKVCKIKVEKKKVKVILTVNIGYARIYLNKQGYS